MKLNTTKTTRLSGWTFLCWINTVDSWLASWQDFQRAASRHERKETFPTLSLSTESWSGLRKMEMEPNKRCFFHKLTVWVGGVLIWTLTGIVFNTIVLILTLKIHKTMKIMTNTFCCRMSLMTFMWYDKLKHRLGSSHGRKDLAEEKTQRICQKKKNGLRCLSSGWCCQ